MSESSSTYSFPLGTYQDGNDSINARRSSTEEFVVYTKQQPASDDPEISPQFHQHLQARQLRNNPLPEINIFNSKSPTPNPIPRPHQELPEIESYQPGTRHSPPPPSSQYHYQPRSRSSYSQQSQGSDRLLPSNAGSRNSVASAESVVNSLYSAGDFDTDIEVNQTLNLVAPPSAPSSELTSGSVVTSEASEKAEEGKRDRFKQLFKSTKVKQSVSLHNDQEQQGFFVSTTNLLNETVYSGSTKGTLELDWDKIVETYLFGDQIDKVFSLGTLTLIQRNNVLINYLLNSHLESGEVKFTLHHSFSLSNIQQNELFDILSTFLAQLDDFNDILNQYKLQLDNGTSQKGAAAARATFNSKDTYDKLEFFANHTGITLPMAQSMFGTWLLSFAKGGSESNYQDVRILNQFRKGARLALILRRLSSANYFEQALKYGNDRGNTFNNYEQIALQRLLKKDNDFALSMALFSIAEYYQYVHGFDTAVNYWEANAHLTKDVESCNLAIWGLSDGFGGGNKVKTVEKLGHGAKRNKFNTKRRIALLTRILSKNGGHAEYGTSWVWKEKYD